MVLHIQDSRNGKRNLKVEELLRIKAIASDLFYLAMLSFEEARPNVSEEEARKREIRNQRRKIDSENEYKTIEFRGQFIDRYPWEQADTKIESLLYLSIGTEATRIYHQNNPHTIIDTGITY